VVGAYPRLVEAIAAVSLPVLIPAAAGLVAGAALAVHLVSWGLSQWPNYTSALFLGVMIAVAGNHALKLRWNRRNLPTAALAAAVAWWIARVPLDQAAELVDPLAGPWALIAGVAGGAGLILPGISGGAILLLLGWYHPIVEALARLDLIVLCIFAVGAVVGIFAWARASRWLFTRFPQQTAGCLTGLVAGSLRVLLPSTPCWRTGLVTLGSMVLGVAVLRAVRRRQDTGAGGRGPWIVLVFLLLISPLGCNARPPSPEVQPVRDDLTLLVEWHQPVLLNPWFRSEPASPAALEQLVYASLLIQDRERLPRPYLAQSYRISQNGRTITFFLREGLTWHDGRPLTAGDVEFTFRTMLRPGSREDMAREWFVLRGAEEFYRGESTELAGVRALSNEAVRFRFNRTDPTALMRIGSFGIVPRHVFAGADPGRLEELVRECSPIGAGPFRCVRRREDETGTRISLQAFPGFVFGTAPLTHLVVTLSPGIPSDWAESWDGLVLGQPAAGRADLAVPEDKVARRAVGDRYFFIGLNLEQPMLAKSSVRRALAQAIDRKTMARGLFGDYHQLVDEPARPDGWAAAPGLVSPVEYDVQEARALLQESGLADLDGDGMLEDEEGHGMLIPLKYPAREPAYQKMAEEVAQYWKKVGVETELRPFTASMLAYEVFSRQRLDACLLAWDWGETPDVRPWQADSPWNVWKYLPQQETASHTEKLANTPRPGAARVSAWWWDKGVATDLPVIFMFAPERVLVLPSSLRHELPWRGDLSQVHGWRWLH